MCQDAGKLGMAVVTAAPDDSLLDCPGHPLGLAVGPRILELCSAELNPVLAATQIKRSSHLDGREDVGATRRKRELDTSIGQHRVSPEAKIEPRTDFYRFRTRRT